MLFGREPALWGVLAKNIVLVLTTFVFAWSVNQQGAVNAVSAALIGLAVAFAVAREKLVPALLGLAEAAVAVAISFGWNLTPDRQLVIMSLVAAVVGIWTRDRVIAPVGEDGTPRA